MHGLLSPEERKEIMRKMGAKVPITWDECDRMLDHIEYLEPLCNVLTPHHVPQTRFTELNLDDLNPAEDAAMDSLDAEAMPHHAVDSIFAPLLDDIFRLPRNTEPEPRWICRLHGDLDGGTFCPRC